LTVRRKNREHEGICDFLVWVFAVLAGESMASSGDKVVMEPLDVDNYDTWCVGMKLILIHKKMWNVVVDSSATAEQSQGALALIGLHVKAHHLGKVAAAKTAKELWDDSETTYKSKKKAMQGRCFSEKGDKYTEVGVR
jgi:hypothetical protein